MTSVTTKNRSVSDHLRHSGPMVPKFTLTGIFSRGALPQTVIVTRNPFRIGRRADLELSLNSPVVSGRHAELFKVNGRLRLRDTSSTNGTFLNGTKITGEVEVDEGDWVEVGDVHLKVGIHEVDNLKQTIPQECMRTSEYDGKTEVSRLRALLELIETRALAPCFQPIHCVNTLDVHGYEYLARSSVEGVRNPGEMFAVAESVGREIDLSLLCREVGTEHSVCLPARTPLFLNTHPGEPLMEVAVPQMRKLRERFPGRPLVLEIHEAAITEPGLVRNVRAALREFNVQLAFDDFGAGQARIRELICAPSDYIKFDAALIRDLQDVSDDQFSLFQSIIRGIRSEGAITVAEGVETEQMLQLCQEIGFDLGQGYVLSRPAIMQPASLRDQTAFL
ncbi:MAG: EAL domain-containing protein [Planctomycetaceae bacterium]|nr:EAL domain-containing protein [Planctomycetaceae bacterium]